MKKYTLEELRDFCDRANTPEKKQIARDFIAGRDYLAPCEKDFLFDLLEDYGEEVNPFLPDYMTANDDERDYSPSNPWDAPGMRVSDFIRGVSYF